MSKNRRIRFASLLASGAAAAGAVAGDANKIVVDGSTTVGPVAKAFAEYYMGKHPEVSITVSESGSGNGAKSLLNGACDVATMSRPMKNAERTAAREAGILPIEHVVALDGIALVVHPGNAVTNLTAALVRRIYAGNVRNWKELGGPDLPVVAISRDTNSGTYECFEALVMKQEKMGARVEYVGSNGAIRQRVISTPAAIGYVGLAFTEGVKAVSVNGTPPSPETVKNNTYPISRPLYFYTNGRPRAGSPLHDFVNLCSTPEGRRIVEDTGFVTTVK
jgi:phosphate transport system substrate-binding protein